VLEVGICHLKDVKRCVVKAGTSSLTDENSRLDVGKIAKLVSELMKLKGTGRFPLLVSSGAIGAGMGKLKMRERPGNMPQLQAAAAIGQGILMQTYEFFFDNYEQPIAQLLLTKDDFANGERYTNLSNTLETLIGWGVIPVINENDTVATEEIKVGDNDTLAAYVAMGIGAQLLIILTDVDGLYTGNPDEDPESKLVDVVEEVTPEVESWASEAGRGFGGMHTKVQAAKKLAKEGIPTVIVNSAEPNILDRVFEGEVGTLFLPQGSKRDG
jgi:glutamate 5-kinase